MKNIVDLFDKKYGVNLLGNLSIKLSTSFNIYKNLILNIDEKSQSLSFFYDTITDEEAHNLLNFNEEESKFIQKILKVREVLSAIGLENNIEFSYLLQFKYDLGVNNFIVYFIITDDSDLQRGYFCINEDKNNFKIINDRIKDFYPDFDLADDSVFYKYLSLIDIKSY